MLNNSFVWTDFTARVRSTRERNIYTWTCLSVHRGDTPFPSNNTSTGPMSFPRGYPSPRQKSYPSPRWGYPVVPPSQDRDGISLSQDRDGVPPSQDKDVVPSSQDRDGVPPSQDRDGVSPSQDKDGVPHSWDSDGTFFPPSTQDGATFRQKPDGVPPPPKNRFYLDRLRRGRCPLVVSQRRIFIFASKFNV